MENAAEHKTLSIAFGDYATVGKNTPHQYWVEFRLRDYPPVVLSWEGEELTFSTTTRMTHGLVPPEVPPGMEQLQQEMYAQAARTKQDPNVRRYNPRENIETWAFLWTVYFLVKQGYTFSVVKDFSDSGWDLGKRLAELCEAKLEKVAPLFSH